MRVADLSENSFVDFRRNNVCFCFKSSENCHSSHEKNADVPNWLLIFFGKKTHSENKKHENRQCFRRTFHINNGNPLKSSRIFRLKPNIFIFSSFFFLYPFFTNFLSFCLFSYIFLFFFVFSSCFFIFHYFSPFSSFSSFFIIFFIF